MERLDQWIRLIQDGWKILFHEKMLDSSLGLCNPLPDGYRLSPLEEWGWLYHDLTSNFEPLPSQLGECTRFKKNTPLILATSHPQGDSLRVGNGKPGALAHRRAQAFFRCGHGWWEMDGDHFGWGRKPRGQLRLRASEPCWLWDTDEGFWRNVEKGYSEWLWMQWFLDDGFC